MAAALTLSIVVMGAGGLWAALWFGLNNAIIPGSIGWHVALPTAVLGVIAFAALREENHWNVQCKTLKRLLPEVRAGDRPIVELNEIRGGLRNTIPLIQQLLLDLRQQKQAIAELEMEIRQRVASRTSALERQVGSLRAQATRDALTGLFNRRMLAECLPQMIDTCKTKKVDLSVLAIDVDNFKPLNDTLGHAAGDDLLKTIAQILRSGVREGDMPVRCGGDEFIVLLPGCPTHAALELAVRMASIVNALGKTMKTPRPPGLSIGVASLRHLVNTSASDEETGKALLEAADKHLYAVKAARKGGRGRSRTDVA